MEDNNSDSNVDYKEFVINPKFEPLFRDDLDQPMYIQNYGGRGSGKSTAVAIAMIELTYSDYNHKILYLRQTMTSIEDSSITDIRDGIKSLGLEDDFRENKGKIINKTTGNFITFKGLRSTGSAKANLKSLSGFTTVVFEEAEEIESFEQFSKVDEGIRVLGIPLKLILIYNPTSALSSWIHQEWFIDGKPNQDRHHDTVFIHSTYHDNIENLNPQKVQRYEDLQRTNPTYYKNVILAEWTLDAQERIYPDWEMLSYSPGEIGDEWYGLDWSYGGNDSTALIRVRYIDGKYYCKTIFEEPKQQIRDTLRKMREAKIPRSARIYADHMPLLIEEIRLGGYMGIRKARKGKVEQGVKKLQDKNIVLVGGENDPLYYHNKTWSRTNGEIKDHEPDGLAALRYAIISHRPRKNSSGTSRQRVNPNPFLSGGGSGFVGGGTSKGFI